MVVRWITSGYLSDPFDEFMVKESGHITKGVLESDYTDEYWERRYTVRQSATCSSGQSLINHHSYEMARLWPHRQRSPLPRPPRPYPPVSLRRDPVQTACQAEPASPRSCNHGSTRYCWQANTSTSSANAGSR